MTAVGSGVISTAAQSAAGSHWSLDVRPRACCSVTNADCHLADYSQITAAAAAAAAATGHRDNRSLQVMNGVRASDQHSVIPTCYVSLQS